MIVPLHLKVETTIRNTCKPGPGALRGGFPALQSQKEDPLVKVSGFGQERDEGRIRAKGRLWCGFGVAERLALGRKRYSPRTGAADVPGSRRHELAGTDFRAGGKKGPGAVATVSVCVSQVSLRGPAGGAPATAPRSSGPAAGSRPISSLRDA